MTATSLDTMWLAAPRGAGFRALLGGRRVTVVGLARSGVAACRLLRALGAVVTGSDARPAAGLAEDARALPGYGVRFVLGGHPAEAFHDAELVVVSPGVPAELPPLQACRARGVPVIGELELAYRATTAPLIAITGTNGKTTTTALAGTLVAESGRAVFVGGNIGRPLSQAVLDLPADGIVVAEVSSFQLETTETFRPAVAALLNLTPDHLDRHPSLDAYADAKARIFARQEADDWAVVNADDPGAAALARRARGRIRWFSRRGPVETGALVRDGWITLRDAGRDTPVCPLAEIFLRGAHNVENVLAATACAAWTGVAPERLRAAIRAFRGVAHRLEWVRELGGVLFYNDSKGTNVDATLKALAAFVEPIVLIAGGRDKGQDFEPLAVAARGRVKAAVLIGEGRDKLARVLGPVTRLLAADSMDEAVRQARAAAAPGDAVLLSPACASFDMFRDYEHRGEVFRAEVLSLPDAASGSADTARHAGAGDR